MNGVVNVNKPAGMTSSDVVYKLRKIFATRSVGHMGTLDPQGTGVLPIGIGKSTRLFDYFLQKDKVYRTTFAFGAETDTLDGEGVVTGVTEIIPTFEDFVAASKKFVGKQLQIPPAYSAKNIDGVRAYTLARAGKEVVLQGKDIEIFDIYDITKENNSFNLTVHCSSGTYIRSLCRDIARELNSLAIMTAIERKRAGIFDIKDSYTLEEISTLKEKVIIPPEKCLDIPLVEVDDAFYSKLLNGMSIKPVGMAAGEVFVKCQGELFGIADSKNGVLKVKTYLKD